MPVTRFAPPFTFHERRLTLHARRNTSREQRVPSDERRPQGGFTLLEVVGVLAIMATLIALIVPNVLDKIDDATRDAEGQNLKAIAQAIELYLRETHALPLDLPTLSPNYLPMGDVSLTRNRGNFPRYYIPHPTMTTFTNAAGLAVNEVPDARFLLISNVRADAAPTITNAAQFDAWWNTDETLTPDLFIERGSVGHLFRLVNLQADTTGGSYSIDGTVTNSGCDITLSHLRSHLIGTRVGVDEALPYSVPEIQFTVHNDTTHHFNPCRPAGLQWRSGPILVQACAGLSGCGSDLGGLWLTTDGDVGSPSGAPGLDSWTDGTVLLFGDPDLAFEPGTTNGTLSSVVDLNSLTQDGGLDLTAMHYVTTNITVGTTNSFDLLEGDLLLAHYGSSSEVLTSTNSLTVNREDVFVFRPDTPGDYSSGSFYMLLDNLSGGDVHSISLVETTTVVGDTTLSAGTFLFSRSGGSQKYDIWHFSATNVGTGTTSGTISLLLDGTQIEINKEPHGLDLIETTLTIGNTTLPSGAILVSLKDDENWVGDNRIPAKQQDIFYLEVTSTEIGSGNSAADATLFLEGGDVGLDTNQEDLSGISVVPTE